MPAGPIESTVPLSDHRVALHMWRRHVRKQLQSR
jgi:hypothetical protein